MLISPSLLAADFSHLSRELEMLDRSNAAMIHLDVMDGVFVPNISIGFPVIESLRPYTTKPFDVHLMIVDPQRYVKECRKAGANIVNVHQEACVHLDRTVHEICEEGMLPAVTLNPATPVETLIDILPQLHMVLLMSVNPGFGGQKFIQHTLDKVRRLRKLIQETGSQALIEIDGGVNLHTGALLAEAGADVLVAGSAVFKSADPVAMIQQLSDLK